MTRGLETFLNKELYNKKEGHIQTTEREEDNITYLCDI